MQAGAECATQRGEKGSMTAQMYNVKRESGYYYTTGNGRYGRVAGLKLMADPMCGLHANGVVEMLTSNGVQAEIEDTSEMKCEVCKREAARR